MEGVLVSMCQLLRNGWAGVNVPKVDGCRDHGMDTQDLEFKFFAKRVETSYVVTATYV